jgi:hypothetical protein
MPTELQAYVDREELSGLDRIVRAHEVSDRSIVVETIDRRELRITAWRDLGSGLYVSDYERRSVIKSGGKEFRVWAHTPAYKRRIADDVASCLEAACSKSTGSTSTDPHTKARRWSSPPRF